jgi:hypothetical protein
VISLVGSWAFRIELVAGSRVCSQSGSLDLKQESFDKRNNQLDFSGSLQLGKSTCPDLALRADTVRVVGILWGEPRVGSSAMFEQWDCGGQCLGYYSFDFTVKNPNLLSGGAFWGSSPVQRCDWVAERRQ